MGQSSPLTEELQRIARALNIQFNQPELLTLAMRHKSVGTHNNERLEFLGDAVLGMVIADSLYARYEQSREDGLSLMRAALVRRDALAVIARELDLGRAIELGPGELKSGGHERNSILADAFEALIGAVYLDQGFAVAEALLQRLFADKLASVEVTKDAKTRLQEWLQSRKAALPTYAVANVTGADHAKQFEVHCTLEDGTSVAVGIASSRRAAEQQAAGKMLTMLGET